MWELKQNGRGVHVQGGLEPSLSVSFIGRAEANNNRNWKVEHIGTYVRAAFAELGVEWPRRYVAVAPRMNAEQHVELHVELPLTPAYLRAIENARQSKRSGDLNLEIWLGIVYVPIAEDNTTHGQLVTFRRGQALTDGDRQQSVRVSQNEWLAVLKTVGHDQVDVFELRSRTNVDVPGFPEALVDLRAAHSSYRESNWQDTIVRARQASEDVLKRLGEGDLQKGVVALGELIFPAEEDKPRRAYIDGVCRAIGSLRHGAGHAGGDVRFRANRADADAALGLALELFRYIASATPRS